MKLIDKVIRIEEYLENWYCALPISALHTLFELEPDTLYTVPEEDFDDVISELRDEWHDLEFIEKVWLHDKYAKEFSEFTPFVVLNINKPISQ